MSDFQRSDLARRWSMLSGNSHEDGGVLSSVVQTKSGLDLRLAVDREGLRHLLIGVRRTDRRVPEDVIGALTVKRKVYTFDGPAAMYLDVRCTRGDLFDIFDELLRDIVTVVLDGGGADTAIEVIQKWRSLLAIRGRQVLSQSAQRGLFAELHVLRIAQADGPIDASFWRGPLQEPHDILMPWIALEVKSVSSQSHSVEIHGAQQMAEPGRPLALVLVEIDEDPTGETVAEMAARLLNDAADRELALSRLTMAGYSQTDSEAYPALFKVRRVRHLVVNDRTPRIVPQAFANGALPEGLLYLNYGLDLHALEQYLIDGESSLQQWIETPQSGGN